MRCGAEKWEQPGSNIMKIKMVHRSYNVPPTFDFQAVTQAALEYSEWQDCNCKILRRIEKHKEWECAEVQKPRLSVWRGDVPWKSKSDYVTYSLQSCRHPFQWIFSINTKDLPWWTKFCEVGCLDPWLWLYPPPPIIFLYPLWHRILELQYYQGACVETWKLGGCDAPFLFFPLAAGLFSFVLACRSSLYSCIAFL